MIEEIISDCFLSEEIIVGDTVYYLPDENGDISSFARWKFDPEALEAPEPIVPGYDGKYYFESQCPEKPAPTREEVRTARARLYAIHVDPLMSEYNRKKTFGVFEEGEETELLAKIEAKVAEIKENNPYPEGNGNEETNNSDASVSDA